ncbi:GNAT family N-acetyltransferase [Microbacterium hydrocarbonoxydans]|uniref:[SSU ribosomal protein S5P]-alanine acetyltransferase n=1 Tax=Microbacterium hydrocarbonoxydans TaxID=273678 RepID=A0A1H4M3T7_9MICO|nr:GNAT family protein [Microbacterium hydrocarbonoxydans]SEB77477.1 [SSU ribosomal protein S5P]-alanine acetyltransferase [Microbacterium hydrocarbonoxydans]
MLPLDAEHSLRPVQVGDGAALARAYSANREHLAPWEPRRSPEFFTAGWQEKDARRCVDDAAAGRGLRFVVESSDGEIRGRINLNNIVRGAFRNADLGYWIDHSVQGRGLASAGVRLVAEYAASDLGLHRLQAGTLLHNAGSQRVLMRCGFTRIGIAPRYLQIAGEWQDHVLFQLLLE